MAKSPLLVLVDGSSYLFRAYYALPPLTTASGFPTGAIHGVISMLKRLIADEQPTYLGVVFDPKGKTFRHEFDPNYKANRATMPEDLAEQIPMLHELIRAMGLPLIIENGVEADDVIGTLAKRAEAAGMNVLISTGDKDMAQLVSSKVSLVNTMNDHRMGPDGVEEKFGVRPEQIIDYLALVGDTSDNIPGVQKVGPKTAVKWIKQYGSLEQIKANADNVGGKVGENLRNGLEQLNDSQFLVTIKCDVELHEEPNELNMQEPDHEHLLSLARECELNSWLKELTAQANGEEPPEAAFFDQTQYETILNKQDAERWFTAVKQSGAFAFDTETNSLNPHQANLVGFSLSCEAGKAAYFPIAHDYDGAPQQLEREWLLAQLQDLLNNKNALLIGQNLKFDLEVLNAAGVSYQCQLFDTLLAAYVLNKTNARLNLGALAKQYLNHNVIEFTDIAGKGAKQLTFNQIDLAQAAPYAAEDADIAWRLYEVLKINLSENKTLGKVFTDLDLPQLALLTRMECHGVLLDAELLGEQSADMQLRLDVLEKKAYELAGNEFNLASPKQLREILFDKQKLPVIKKTPKGDPSTNEEVLQQLALDYPLPKLIIEYRSLSKLKSTYTDKLPEEINPHTGRVHTNYNQALTSTGRLSSNNPNLQNIPVRSEQGRKIREAFIAPDGYQILAADYSQVELRIIAHLSEDKGLLKAFADGLDIHRATASEVFATPFDQVTSDQRRSAKAINFGLLYGMSAFGLAKQLDIGRGEAQTYLETYFQRYPGVKTYLDETRELAGQQGYVETLYRRRVYLPNIHAKQAMLRQAAERAAINAPMQGTAADLIKLAMIAVQDWIDNNQAPATMIMQVHDELVFEIKKEAVEEASKHITQAMSGIAQLKVPLVVDIGVGDNWEQAH
jgi:DNA polymerase-1